MENCERADGHSVRECIWIIEYINEAFWSQDYAIDYIFLFDYIPLVYN